jgi:hypothetical protein
LSSKTAPIPRRPHCDNPDNSSGVPPTSANIREMLGEGVSSVLASMADSRRLLVKHGHRFTFCFRRSEFQAILFEPCRSPSLRYGYEDRACQSGAPET